MRVTPGWLKVVKTGSLCEECWVQCLDAQWVKTFFEWIQDTCVNLGALGRQEKGDPVRQQVLAASASEEHSGKSLTRCVLHSSDVEECVIPCKCLLHPQRTASGSLCLPSVVRRAPAVYIASAHTLTSTLSGKRSSAVRDSQMPHLPFAYSLDFASSPNTHFLVFWAPSKAYLSLDFF